MLISLIGGVIGIAHRHRRARCWSGKFGALPVALNGQVVALAAGVLDRDRAVLRLLPGAQGVAAGPDRGAAPAVVGRGGGMLGGAMPSRSIRTCARSLLDPRLLACAAMTACTLKSQPKRRRPRWSSTAAPGVIERDSLCAGRRSASPRRPRPRARRRQRGAGEAAAARSMRSSRRSWCWRNRRTSTPARARCSTPRAATNSMPRSWKATPAAPARSPA